MARSKVKLAFIMNEVKRKAAYKKRKKGLLNKVSELSTLCGINACAVIYSAYDPEPEVWPNPAGAQRVILEFKDLPDKDKGRKMLNQESFLRERLVKLKDQLKKQLFQIREKELNELMFKCVSTRKGELVNLSKSDLDDLQIKIEMKLKELNIKIETVASERLGLQSPQQPPPEPLTKNDELSYSGKV